MKHVLLSFSGGLDSTTLLGKYIEQGHRVTACFFDYGSKHNDWEYQAANQIIEYYKQYGVYVDLIRFDLTNVFSNFSSVLIDKDQDIPEGHFESEVMKHTVVPSRNMIFSAILAGYAETIEASEIILGVHQGDHAIYPDCRPEFIDSMNRSIELSTENQVRLKTGLLSGDKSFVIKIGLEQSIRIPYELTRTCYKDQSMGCGQCAACVERKEAFEKLGLKDPVSYEYIK